MLKNKLFYFVVFAVAAIFATTFVSCGGDGDTKDNYITSSKVPANLATSSLLASLYEAGNDTIVISNPVAVGGVMGEDMVALTDDLIIPLGKTLNLNGHPLSVASAKVLVVAGELAGLETATADGGQIADSGTIIAKSATEATRIAGFKATGASAIVIEAMSVPGTAGGSTVGKTYFFGDITVAADLANVVTVFGSVTLSAATTAAPDLSSLASISGSLSLTSTAGADDAAVAFAVGTLEVKGSVTVNGKATLADTTSLTVGGNLTLGDNVALTATLVGVTGNITAKSVSLVASTGQIALDGTATIADGVTFKGTIGNIHSGPVAISTVIPAIIEGTSAVLNGFIVVTDAAAIGVPTTKTLTIKSGTLKVKEGKTITLPNCTTAGDTALIVAAGAVLDLTANTSSITLVWHASKAPDVILKPVSGTEADAGGGGKILLDSTVSLTAIAKGGAVNVAVLTAVGDATDFTFGTGSSGGWATDHVVPATASAAALKSIEASTSADASKGTVKLSGATSTANSVLSKASKFGTTS